MEDSLWRPKAAVLLHVFDCKDPNWEYAMVGTPDCPGRIPIAVAAALEFAAESLLVFRDRLVYHEDGRNEAEVIRDTLFALIDQLPNFSDALPCFQHFSPLFIRLLMEHIFKISDVFIERTADEIREVLPILKMMGVESAVFVSNIDHIPRIVQLIGEFWAGESLAARVVLRLAPAMYASNVSMRNMVVLDPRAVLSLGLADPRRLLKMRGNEKAIAELDALLRRYGA